MASPYAPYISSSVIEIQQSFTQEFGIATPYTKDNLIPGNIYGVINSTDFSYGDDVRGGYQDASLNFALTLSGVFPSRQEGDRQAASMKLNLHHGIPAIKQLLNPWDVPGCGPFDFALVGDVASMGESVKFANNTQGWKIYAIAEAVLKFKIYKDIFGQHALPPTVWVE